MKNLLTTIFLISIGYYTTFAQRFSTEFGKIGKDEIELKTYTNDKKAEAVVLFDIGKSYFVPTNTSFDLIFEHSKRIKILSEAGIDYAEIEIPFYREGNIFESIYDLEAYTYNFENGVLNRTEINKNDLHDEKLNEYWMVRKFAMPNVKEGSIIEFRYKLNSQYLFNLRDWSFQDRIPTVYSQYEVRMIPFYEYSYVLQGISKFDSYETYVNKRYSHQFGLTTYNDVVHKFTMKDVPAFENEEYITSIKDYLIKIDFQLAKIHYSNGSEQDIITTWHKLIKEFDDHVDFGKYVRKSEKLAEKTLDIKTLHSLPESERFEEIVNHIKNNYNWNGFNAKFASKTPNKTIDDKFGNAADLNLLLTGFLNAAGIEAYPVLISTRNNGKVSADYPYNHYFNFVIVYAKVDNKNVLTDATEVNSSPYRIPENCINDRGLLIKEEDQVEWISLQSSIPTQTKTDINLEVNEESTEASIKISSNEYEALSFRKEIGDDKQKLMEWLKKKYEVEESNVSLSPNNLKEENYTFEFQPKVQPEIINNKIYLSPFLKETLLNNPLNQTTRTYPIDMVYPTRSVLTSVIELPENYSVEFIPDNLKINNTLIEIEYTTEKKDNILEIRFSVFFKKAVYEADAYQKIKYYFNEIVKKGNEKVVLVKI